MAKHKEAPAVLMLFPMLGGFLLGWVFRGIKKS